MVLKITAADGDTALNDKKRKKNLNFKFSPRLTMGIDLRRSRMVYNPVTEGRRVECNLLHDRALSLDGVRVKKFTLYH